MEIQMHEKAWKLWDVHTLKAPACTMAQFYLNTGYKSVRVKLEAGKFNVYVLKGI